MHLSSWEKLVVIAIAGIVVLIVLVLTICTVSSFCYIYQCIHGAPKPRSAKSSIKSEGNGSSKKKSNQDESTPLQIALVNEKLKSVNGYGDYENNCCLQSANKRPTDSTYSSMSTCSHEESAPSLSVHSEIHELGEPPTKNGSLSSNYGQVTLTICFTIAEAQVVGQLLICIIEAQDLPPREYNGACDPYINVVVCKSKGRRNKSKKHIVLQKYSTTVMKKTQHPIYKETFMLEINKSELKECSLKLEAFDCDRYANDTQLSEIRLFLKDLDIRVNEEPQVLAVDFSEPRVDNGEILFSMNYLPTAERLSFNIAKTSNLKVSVSDLELFTPYVRILLFHNGKIVKKKKTSTRRGSISPTFDETIAFDIPNKELENVSFIIVVCHRPTQSPESESDFSSPEGLGYLRPDKDRFIGKVVIGNGSNSLALQHWLNVLQSPRKQLSQWHTLY